VVTAGVVGDLGGEHLLETSVVGSRSPVCEAARALRVALCGIADDKSCGEVQACRNDGRAE